MFLGGNCIHGEEPQRFLQGFTRVPGCHEQVVLFDSVYFIENDAMVYGVMYIFAPDSPGAKIGEPAIHERLEDLR